MAVVMAYRPFFANAVRAHLARIAVADIACSALVGRCSDMAARRMSHDRDGRGTSVGAKPAKRSSAGRCGSCPSIPHTQAADESFMARIAAALAMLCVATACNEPQG